MLCARAVVLCGRGGAARRGAVGVHFGEKINNNRVDNTLHPHLNTAGSARRRLDDAHRARRWRGRSGRSRVLRRGQR